MHGRGRRYRTFYEFFLTDHLFVPINHMIPRRKRANDRLAEVVSDDKFGHSDTGVRVLICESLPGPR
jgi:hypothetical protein